VKRKTKFITHAAVIAALYVVLTTLAAMLSLDKGVIQFRISEALTVLPCLTPAAIPGLFIGCLLSSVFNMAIPADVVFGSLATLLGAIGTYIIGRRVKWLSALPPILANMLVIPLVLRFGYHAEGTLPFFVLTVGAGEVVCAGLLGTLLLYAMPKRLENELKL